MSAVEFGLTPQSALVNTLSSVTFEQPLRGPELTRPYESLFYLSRSLASMTREILSRDLAALLRPLFPCDFVNIVVFDSGGHDVCWRSLDADQLAPLDVPIRETTVWSVYQEQKPLWIADWQHDERIAVRKEAENTPDAGYRSLCRLPLSTPYGCFGVLSIARSRPQRYTDQEVQLLLLIADQVALGLASSLNIEARRRTQSELEGAAARLKLLADLSTGLAGTKPDSFLAELTVKIRRLMTSDLAILGLWHGDDDGFQVVASDVADDLALSQESIESLGGVFWEHAVSSDQGWTGRLEDLNQDQMADLEWKAALSMNSCVLPLETRGHVLGVLALGRRDKPAYSQDELDYLGQVSSQVAVALQNALLHAELQKLKDEHGEDNVGLEHELSAEPSFEEIVGRSPALQRVLRNVEVVAPTDSGVLIQGETGTGKELIARAIHNRSARRDKPFVRVNCAAIPSGLLESELFGHEKGAFTGAIMRKPGRFEVADKGTLFLDEVGDIPLDLQSKLLRVLQEREFERLGSTHTQQVDVRVIAATHRDLKQMIAAGTFRSDLYYRLHVFPLVVPPLRDRREDIPHIVRHYVDKYARRMSRRIETIPARTMEVFTNHPWPGNVRELQNLVERAVILSPGKCLQAPLEELEQETTKDAPAKLNTLEEMEREYVLRALRESNWVTGGPNGAAVRLGMKRTTLAYRIRKLKIPCRPK
jgi:formate hydrogenlyase transcriptional activator